jgi:GNAT superfamily N-acetyltransferase
MENQSNHPCKPSTSNTEALAITNVGRQIRPTFVYDTVCPMPFTVRSATIDDAASIAFVHVNSWKTTYTGIVADEVLNYLDVPSRTENWRDWLAKDIVVFLAEDASGVFGFATGGPLREPIEPYDAELYSIYLLQSHHKLGAGKELTRKVATQLHHRRLNSLLVWVLEQNPAVFFYKHLGAIQVAQKSIDIGGFTLQELAFGWPTLDRLL